MVLWSAIIIFFSRGTTFDKNVQMKKGNGCNLSRSTMLHAENYILHIFLNILGYKGSIQESVATLS